jgi:hemoglobin-like flavoprotein
MLRSSFKRVVELSPCFAVRFYDILFERYPSVRGMFSSDVRAHQPAKLATALASVMDKLDKPGVLAESLGALGKRHERYGATPGMYAAVGECLIAAISETLGSEWNAELEYQWAAAYVEIVTLMAPAASFYSTIPAPPMDQPTTKAA